MTQLPAFCFIAMLVFASSAMAQATGLFARVSSVTGGASLSTGEGSPFSLTRGYSLNPGDCVDTRQGGRVVIDLSDGSLVIIQPGTLVTIKDFRAAASIRELFEIAIGAVRVRIHHLTGKPNPYRMNSPTASIAVRGTEFDVIVGGDGDTKVDVFEGAVEVGRLDDPSDRVLIEAGRGVLVRPGQTLQLFGVPLARVMPGVRITVSRDYPRGQPVAVSQPVNVIAQRQPASLHSIWQAPEAGQPLMAMLDAHVVDSRSGTAFRMPTPDQRFAAALTTSPEVPLLYRFNAFADLHLDTYENPAYATSGESEARASLYGRSPQISVIESVGKGFVVGGTVTSARSGAAGTRTLGTAPIENALQADLALSSFSAFVARRFGDSSLGVSLERLRIGSSSTVETGPFSVYTNAFSRQTRMTAGVTRHIGRRTDLGGYVRYGLVTAGAAENHTAVGRFTQASQMVASGNTVEGGVRLRGVLTPRLSYGVTAGLSNAVLANVTTRTNSVAAGVGYLVNRDTLVSMDVTAGMLRSAGISSPFQSIHLSVQTDITKRLFGTASFLNAWRNDAVPLPLWRTRYSEAGVGWRFSPDWIAQYTLAKDNIFGEPQHAIALRYTFQLRPR